MIDGPRVAVIGLDCGTPHLLFDELAAEVPNISSLMQRGMYGELASVMPPITVPAWACAMTGSDPGELGIYGFRNRSDAGYASLSVTTSADVPLPAVWDVLGHHGGRSLLIGVPPGYPARPLAGWRVSCFLTPDGAGSYTYPAELAAEIDDILGGSGRYIFDIPNVRSQPLDEVFDRLFVMTERRFAVARRLLRNKPWDFFMLVEIGLDRLHHVFWHHVDPLHPKYQPGNPFEMAFRAYYNFLDDEVGSLLEALPDDVIVMLMSDHGGQPMVGGLCFNDWLVQQGLLTLTDSVRTPTQIDDAPVDWSRTLAWGAGGYYGRLFLNVKGREPQGVIDPRNYDDVRDELIERLESIESPEGQPLGTRAYKPQDIYRKTRGLPPDLIVYFGDLAWRSVGSLGAADVGDFFTYENDTGPDGANHDPAGFIVVAGAPGQPIGRRDGFQLTDVGPTVLSLYGIAGNDPATRSFL